MRKLGWLAVAGILGAGCGGHKSKGEPELKPGTTEGRDRNGAEAMLQGTWYMACTPWSAANQERLPAEVKAKTELWVFKDYNYLKTMTAYSDSTCKKALVSYSWQSKYKVDMGSSTKDQHTFYVIDSFRETTGFTAELLDKEAKLKAPCIKEAVLKDKVSCSYQGGSLIVFKIDDHRLQFEGKGPWLNWMAGA